MSTSQIRWGRLKTVSNDKGPYKLATFDVDGAERDAQVMEISGVQVNPQQDSIAMIICPDGDEGRMFAIVMPPPGSRTDGQKEGEATFTNHKAGQTIKMDADGNVLVKSAGGVIHLNPT